MMRLFVSLILLSSLLFCSSYVDVYGGWDPRKAAPDSGKTSHSAKTQTTINKFLQKDPTLKTFFDQAYGYAVFPGVGKGGIGIGGAYGKGEVYRQGAYLGRAKLTQLTIGFQLGGQKYAEVIFFKNKSALDNFTGGNFEFSAQASAVAVTAGASADADYENDVAVFTMTIGGLMYEATIGGQKFSFKPK